MIKCIKRIHREFDHPANDSDSIKDTNHYLTLLDIYYSFNIIVTFNIISLIQYFILSLKVKYGHLKNSNIFFAFIVKLYVQLPTIT